MKPKILIVEDNNETALALDTLLTSAGFRCTAVESRDAALSLLQSGYVPVCILMDYMMPGTSMTVFMNEIEELGLRIVLMTAYSDIERIAKRFGIRYILRKPVIPADVISVVKQAVESGEHAAV
jgi:CheY-like chemotaxis protein